MWENFLISLMIMLRGMAGIFIVIAILTLVVVIMNKFSAPKKDKNVQ